MYSINKNKDDRIKREVSTSKMTKKMFCTLFFMFMTAYGYFVLKQTEYLPWFLGGSASSADVAKLYEKYPVQDHPEYNDSLRLYYLISFGYHIKSLYSLWSDNRKAPRHDLLEMILHHVTTIMLYFYSYYNYIHKFGSLVMFLHDWADITTSFMKFIYETEYKSIIYANAFTNLFIWGYSRLFAYPLLIFYGKIYRPPVQQVADQFSALSDE